MKSGREQIQEYCHAHTKLSRRISNGSPNSAGSSEISVTTRWMNGTCIARGMDPKRSCSFPRKRGTYHPKDRPADGEEGLHAFGRFYPFPVIPRYWHSVECLCAGEFLYKNDAMLCHSLWCRPMAGSVTAAYTVPWSRKDMPSIPTMMYSSSCSPIHLIGRLMRRLWTLS